MLRPASLLPSRSRAFDTPLRTVGSLLPPGVCYRALRRLPGPIFHRLDERVFQDAPSIHSMVLRYGCHQERGPVAQLGARFHGMEEVIGSNPIRSTKFLAASLLTATLTFSTVYPTRVNGRLQLENSLTLATPICPRMLYPLTSHRPHKRDCHADPPRLPAM